MSSDRETEKETVCEGPRCNKIILIIACAVHKGTAGLSLSLSHFLSAANSAVNVLPHTGIPTRAHPKLALSMEMLMVSGMAWNTCFQ